MTREYEKQKQPLGESKKTYAYPRAETRTFCYFKDGYFVVNDWWVAPIRDCGILLRPCFDLLLLTTLWS